MEVEIGRDSEHGLDGKDIGAFFEGAGDGSALAGDPDVEFGVHVEGPCGFDGETGDGFVGDREVLGFCRVYSVYR